MQKHVNLVDLVKSFLTNIFLQTLASIFNHFLERGLLASQPASQPISVNLACFHENMKFRIFEFSNFHIFIRCWIFSSGRLSTVRPPSVRAPVLSPSRVAVRPPSIHRPSVLHSSTVRRPARPPARASVRPVSVNLACFHENMKFRIFIFSYFHIFIFSY